MPGKYQALYEYFENRYADTVVLTFDQNRRHPRLHAA